VVVKEQKAKEKGGKKDPVVAAKESPDSCSKHHHFVC
jgi:hypothetical protein